MNIVVHGIENEREKKMLARQIAKLHVEMVYEYLDDMYYQDKEKEEVLLAIKTYLSKN